MSERKKRTARAKVVEVDGKPLAGELKPEDLKNSTSIKFDFETALDFILFKLADLKSSAKKMDNTEYYNYLEEMEDYLGTRVTDLQIYPNPESDIPYKYNVNYTAQEGETKQEVASKIKEYLTSNTFNIILAMVSPKKEKEQILQIVQKKDELRQIEAKLRKEKKRAGIKTKFKAGKHLVDNILRSTYEPSKILNQLPLFETLGDQTKERVLASGVSIEMINSKGEGIRLSKGEYKLLLCLGKLLEDKSQTIDKKQEDYYSGDKYLPSEGVSEITTNKGEVIQLKTPKMSFTFYEIAKEFSLEKNPGGENINEVAKLLGNLADNPEKKALIRYTRKERIGKNKEREVKIETFAPLIQILNVEIKDTLNGVEIDQAKEIFVNLHPVFIDQIDKVFIELPIPKEIMKAYGGANVSAVAQKLIFELSRALSNKRNYPKDENKNIVYSISVKKLYWKIAESYMKGSKKSVIKRYFLKAVETAKALGILIDFSEEPGATGENIFKFTLSKDW